MRLLRGSASEDKILENLHQLTNRLEMAVEFVSIDAAARQVVHRVPIGEKSLHRLAQRILFLDGEIPVFEQTAALGH